MSYPLPEQVLFPSIFSALCRHTKAQADRKRDRIKNSVKEIALRKEFIIDVDAKELAETRKQIVEYWPEMRPKG